MLVLTKIPPKKYRKLKYPEKPFLRYMGHDGKESDFSEKLEHGYPLLPIVRLQDHPIFGFSS